MAIRIYNTLNRKKELFEPIQPGKVNMYVCGPTVYDSCHIGHARAVVVFDVIVRYFRSQGFDVTYVRNFTDVDDKIINRANELNVDWDKIALKYIDEFYEDMDALNIKRATIEPKATDHIDDIIAIIEKLIQKGRAYHVDGDVFFAIDTFAEYGRLSGRKLEEMEPGARIGIDKRKHNPFDFALWKSAKPGEPFWESPWGKGRPGWHIECSAMSWKYLGETFDIHGGGKDLIFPHHENEIAQSQGAFDKTFVNYWIHNGFVNIDQEKMSKSLGNFKTIKDVLATYDPEAVRLFLLSNHYRSPIDFTDKSLAEITNALDRVYSLLERVEEKIGDFNDIKSQDQEYWEIFCKAMDDDFNTALGIATLFDAVRNSNRILDEHNDKPDGAIKQQLLSSISDIMQMGNILGILTKKPKAYFANKKQAALESNEIDPEMIEKFIEQRAQARKAKDFAKADQIRDKLLDMNIIIEDRPDKTVWKINS